MHVPLTYIVYFLDQILRLVEQHLSDKPGAYREVLNYSNLLRNQVNFVLSFVEDLIDLRQLWSGNL